MPFGVLFNCILFLREDTTTRASLEAQRLKNTAAMQETQIRSLGREDSIEKEMATHSSILAWRILWTEEPKGYSPKGRTWSDMTEAT